MCGSHCFVNYTFCLTKFHVAVAVVFRKIPSDPSDAVVGASGKGNRNIILQVQKFISFSFLLHVFTLHAILYTANIIATRRSKFHDVTVKAYCETCSEQKTTS